LIKINMLNDFERPKREGGSTREIDMTPNDALLMLHCTLVVNGTSRYFAAEQQTVAFGSFSTISDYPRDVPLLTPKKRTSAGAPLIGSVMIGSV
jgi:hypothetical protein